MLDALAIYKRAFADGFADLDIVLVLDYVELGFALVGWVKGLKDLEIRKSIAFAHVYFWG